MALLLAPAAAWAHGDAAPFPGSGRWVTALLLLLLAAGYAALWRRTPRARRRELIAFLTGCIALAAAMIWPLESWSTGSLAAHMGQHLVLMAVAAPLLALGLPPRLFPGRLLRRTPARARRRAVRLLRAALDPRGLLAAHTLLLIFWHLPQALALALASEALHVLMHGTLLAAALLFWMAILQSGGRAGAGLGGAALLLLTTMTVMALMGAVLTLAPRTLYAAYPRLADQQLAGLLMWIPATLPYLAAGLWLGARQLARAAPPA